MIQELGVGGAERVALTLAGARSTGSAAVAAAPGELGDLWTGSLYPVPHLARRPHRLPLAALRIRQAAAEFRPDVVHAHNPGMAVATALATRRGARPPAVATIHGMPDADYPVACRVLRLAALPLVACGPGVEQALEHHGLAPTATIVNAVGPTPNPADRALLYDEWDVPADRRLIVAVGRLAEQKNHAMAIRVLPHLPDVHLVIVGGGPLAGALTRQAAELGVDHRLTLAGVRPDARAIMGAADVIVLPSRWEGLPLVALEAMASGVPLVATAATGIRELVEDGRTGALVDVDDADAMARAVREVLDDRSLAASRVAAAADVARLHTEEAMISRYERVYEEVLRCRR